MNDVSDQFLVRRVLQGDINCFEVLCKRYYASLQAVAYAVLMDEHLAEDAAQETLAQACRNIQKLRQAEKVGPWLASICRNVARDMLSLRARQKESDRSEHSENLHDSDGLSRDIRKAVDQAVDQLPARLREIVILRYFDDLSYQQMGSILGLSEQAINGRLRRAKNKIEKSLNRSGFRRDNP